MAILNVDIDFKAAVSKIDTLELDAALSETQTFESEVSEHPVEVGANVVDHIRPKPVVLRVDGVVTNTPTTPVQVRRAANDAGVSLDAPQYVAGRAQAALAFLLDLRDNPRLVTVTTKRAAYEEMALVSLSVPEDRTTGDVLRFSATFRQVRTITLRRVVLQVAEPQLEKKVKAGTKPTATAPAELQSKSVAKRIADTGAGNAVLEFLGVR